MHLIDDLILFASSLDLTMLSIDNMVFEEQKQYVSKA
jgi:hypothetical protein